MLPTLRNPRYGARSFQFSDDIAAAPDAGTDTDSPEYTFDGYNVEVSQKITLTPITPRHHHTKTPDAK